MKISELIDIRSSYAATLKEEYEKYLSQKINKLKNLPKLMYIANGKNGWSGPVDTYVRFNAIPVVSGDKILFCLDDCKLYAMFYGPLKLVEPTQEMIFNINPNFILDINIERTCDNAYNKKNNESSQVLPLEEWTIKGIKIGLDITYEDALNHYKGIEDKYVYRHCKNHLEFEALKQGLINSLAKQYLRA